MKKLILLLALMIGFGFAQAQMRNASPEKRAARITKQLTKELSLSSDQAQQVNTAFLMQATRLDSLKSNPSVDKSESRLTAKTIVMTTQKNVMAVLNDTQKQQFVAWEKEKLSKRKGGAMATMDDQNK